MRIRICFITFNELLSLSGADIHDMHANHFIYLPINHLIPLKILKIQNQRVQVKNLSDKYLERTTLNDLVSLNGADIY